MSENTENTDNVNNENTDVQDELTLLKQRADLMGISYHPSIGLVKLKAKVTAKQDGKEEPSYDDEQIDTIDAAQEAGKANVFTQGLRETPAQLKAKRKLEALRLVRVRVTCMNPIKGNMRGEILSVGNAELGMIKKFIPFNAEQGWHIPNILLQELRNKKYMSHYEVKIGNKKIKKHRLVSEYAIEIMSPLNVKELDELKQRQIIASAGQE